MIILTNKSAWEMLAEPFLNGSPISGILMIEEHLLTNDKEHWVRDTGDQRLLGRINLNKIQPPTTTNEISKQHIIMTGFPSEQSIPGIKDILKVIVVEMQVAEVEKYHCPRCYSISLEFLKKNIIGKSLPFSCLDCEEKEFYLPDREKDSPPWVKNPYLETRYCKEQSKRIPAGQRTISVVLGEKWVL